MVMVYSSVEEMNSLLGKALKRKDYEDMSFLYGMDISGSGDVLEFEVTSDRPEMVSKYSIAFTFSRILGSSIRRYEKIIYKSAPITIGKTSRPFVNLLLLNLPMPVGKEAKNLIDMQSKLDATIGRNRKSAAIGLFDMDKISFPLKYSESSAEKISFVPLGYSNEKSYAEILEELDCGKEYGHINDGKPIVWTDGNRRIFALPPVINADFASISEKTRSIFIDITGLDRNIVNSITKAFIFNAQFLGNVTVLKPKYESKDLNTSFSLGETSLDLSRSYVNSLIGQDIRDTEIKSALKKAGYTFKETAKGFVVRSPFYRQDIKHQADIVDDILRFYGVSNIKPATINLRKIGEALSGSDIIEDIRDVLVGFGYQETDLNVLSKENIQFRIVGLRPEDYAAFSGFKSGETTMARKYLFPEELRFISNNSHKKFPQNLFDIGFSVELSGSDVRFSNRLKLCVVACGQGKNISDVRVALDRVLIDAFGLDRAEIKQGEDSKVFDGTFIKGRFGSVVSQGKSIGIIGEVHPKVLNEFNIDLPVALAEIYLDKLLAYRDKPKSE